MTIKVDHVIPLQGEFVSGRHVAENLQLLHEKDNQSKKNRFDIEGHVEPLIPTNFKGYHVR